ncbi:MAG: MBOAT family protein [Eubacteriaceae bacterium]|nr:MBOAT family protein [Eubacteriaceae bacterium]
MSFISYSFVAFLAVLYVLYYLLPKKTQWLLLLVGSLVFYAHAGWYSFIFILVVAAVVYTAGIKIQDQYDARDEEISANQQLFSKDEQRQIKAQAKAKAKTFLAASLATVLGILAVIKYTSFVINNVNSIIGSNFVPYRFILPMGISFYTFQSVGYAADVYWEKTRAERNPLKLMLFVSFFPQLVQGPISRFGELSGTLLSEHKFEPKQAAFGFQRVLWGFFKKLVVADRLVILVRSLILDPAAYRGAYVVLLVFFYAIQLYSDFTGGIDIAIGAAEMFGVVVAENFARPFFSKNAAEYWRRWHITMGAWFKDYVFYPVSVSKAMQRISSKSRSTFGQKIGRRIPVYLTSIVVWAATGIWHGAAWNFVVWGLLNCLVIIVSQEMEPAYKKFHEKYPFSNTRAYDFLQIVRTFWIMGFIRVLDCYQNVPLTFRQVASVFTASNWSVLFNGSLLELGLSEADFVAVALGCIVMVSVSLLQEKGSVRELLAAKPTVLRYSVVWLALASIILLGAYGIGFDANQFIYNRF